MKYFKHVLVLGIACTGMMGTSALGSPADVWMARGDEIGCGSGWLTVDNEFVFVSGYYITYVVTNNKRGNEMFSCHIDHSWTEPVMAYNPATDMLEYVWLADFDQVCDVFGLCSQGNGGALILDYYNTGGLCWGDFGPTRNWKRVISPSGQETTQCKWPD